MLLFAFVAAALTGVFDPGHEETVASEGGITIEAKTPSVARGGLDSTLDLTISKPGGFEEPVQVAITADWLDMFQQAGIDPEPEGATADPERVIWSFEPPPGDSLEVSVDLTMRPAVRTGEEAHLAVVDEDGNDLASLDFDTRVVP